MRSTHFFCCITLLAWAMYSSAQGVGIGTTSPAASAILELRSTTKGLLLPRMSMSQRNAIVMPTTGLMIYQTDNTPGFYFYNGTSWIQLSTGNATNYWSPNGNHINNNNSGNVGINTSNPAYKLDVQGRIRVKAGTPGQVGTSAGIWMDDYLDGTNRFFFGMKDSIRAGFYGAGGVGWDLIWNTQTGNMGIGDLDPLYKLTVNGEVGLFRETQNGYVNYGTLLYETGSLVINSKLGNTLLGINPEHVILQYENSSLYTSGNVGIGTNAPLSKLHIDGNQRVNGKITLQNNLSDEWELDAVGNNVELIKISAGAGNLRIKAITPQILFNHGGSDKGAIWSDGINFLIGTADGNTNGTFALRTNAGEHFWITSGGQIIMGNHFQTSPGYWVNVTGKIICEEVKVQLSANWPDYVFHKDYQLQSFEELRRYISLHQHLPNIPPASELEGTGVELGEMQRKMMEKIEELTLYILQLEEEMQELRTRVQLLSMH